MTSPADPALADALADAASAYVHIPFCARRCPYCAFNIVVGRDDLAPRLVDAILRQIEGERPWRPLDAVAFGGGTPSRLHPDGIAAILDALETRFGLAPDVEIGLEANPEDVDVATARSWVGAGVTRVSIGAQSMDDAVLVALGRAHHADGVARAVEILRSAGVRSVGMDLIFGTPGETLASWESTVGSALALAPDHVSAYALTVEPGTELSRSVRAGRPAPDPDDQADKWEIVMEATAAAGLVRYEVSNTARPGHEVRYNLAVWAGGEYLGIGPGGNGHRDGVRYRNVARIDAYIDRAMKGDDVRSGQERLEPAAAARERTVLGIRRAVGVPIGAVERALLGSAGGRRLADAGVIELRQGRMTVARPLLTDEVSRAVLSLGE